MNGVKAPKWPAANEEAVPSAASPLVGEQLQSETRAGNPGERITTTGNRPTDNVANRRVPNPVDTNGATACEVRNCQLSGQRMRCPDPAKVYPWDALRPLAIDHPKNLVDTSDAMRRSAVSGELGGRLEPTHKASLLLRHPASKPCPVWKGSKPETHHP